MVKVCVSNQVTETTRKTQDTREKAEQHGKKKGLNDLRQRGEDDGRRKGENACQKSRAYDRSSMQMRKR
jgi:hypothetical protein